MSEESKVEIPHLQCMDRISKLPVVEHVWNQTTDLYGKFKESNKMVAWTLNTAEAAAKKSLQQAAPIAHKLEYPIRTVDVILCKGITAVEEKIPLVKQQPNQIYEAVKQLGTEKAIAVRDYSWSKTNELLSTKYGKMAVNTLDKTANVAHQYVDHYLPPSTDEDVQKSQDNTVKDHVDRDEVAHAFEVVGKLSNKIRYRVDTALTLQMRGLKKQSDETIASLAHDLLAKLNVDPKLLLDKVNAIWADLNKEEKEDATVEQKSLSLAQKFTRGILNFYVKVQNNLKSQVESTTGYARNLYTNLKEKIVVKGSASHELASSSEPETAVKLPEQTCAPTTEPATPVKTVPQEKVETAEKEPKKDTVDLSATSEISKSLKSTLKESK